MKRLLFKLIPVQLAILGSLIIPTELIHAKDIGKDGSIRTQNVSKKDYPGLAKISLQEAISTATKKFPGKAIEAELESEDGFLIYEVKVMSSDKATTKVFVDAGNSNILGTEREGKLG